MTQSSQMWPEGMTKFLSLIYCGFLCRVRDFTGDGLEANRLYLVSVALDCIQHTHSYVISINQSIDAFISSGTETIAWLWFYGILSMEIAAVDCLNKSLLISKVNGKYESSYSFRKNTMEEIFDVQLEAVLKFWQMISKPTQLISICSTVNKDLQGMGIFIL